MGYQRINQNFELRAHIRICAGVQVGAPIVSRRLKEAALLDRDRDLGRVLDRTAIRDARHRNRKGIGRGSLIWI